MEKISFTSTVNEGGKVSCALALRSLLEKSVGRKVKITVEDYKKTRSLNQNAYWFGILELHVVPYFRDTGDVWDVFGVHEHIMESLGYIEARFTPKGKPYPKRKHSSKFTTVEWEEFMTRARAWLMTEYQIYVPEPNEGIIHG